MTTPADLELPLISRGNDWVHTLRFWRDRAKTQSLDLSGRVYVAKLWVPGEDPIDFTLDTSQLADGVLVMSLIHDTTLGLTPRSHSWRLHEDASGVFTTLLAGKVPVSKDSWP